MSKMLVFDPSRRIKVEQVLEHPYLASLHDLSDEPVCPRAFTFDFDQVRPTRPTYALLRPLTPLSGVALRR